jgi:hypothetical protein
MEISIYDTLDFEGKKKFEFEDIWRQMDLSRQNSSWI